LSAMAYDETRQRVVLFAGMDGAGTSMSDLWEWDGTSWMPVIALTSPPARYFHAMAYARDRQRITVFGGYFRADTWEWDGTSWLARTPVRRRADHRLAFTMAYDDVVGSLVLFDGANTGQFWP